MKKLKMSSADMVAKAKARIEEVDTDAAIALVGDPDVVFVDLRDVRERQKLGFIPGSIHCPRGMIEFWVDRIAPITRRSSRRKNASSSIAPQGGALHSLSRRFRIWALKLPI